jgi:DMSO/TMAO reductase YedYZ heme-binding membrane subunit
MPAHKKRKVTKKVSTQSHPHHWDQPKNINHKFFDMAVPIGLLAIFFIFYNKGVITGSEAVKTSGLLSIALLSATLVVGPASRIIPFFEQFKANRKVWGILSFWIVLLHMALVGIVYWHWDFTKLFDISNPKYNGIASGILAVVILGLVSFTSNEKMIRKMSPTTWKIIQTTSYIALALAVLHFYLMEQKDGVLVIKRLLGRLTFYFAFAVVILRLFVMFLPSKKK